MIAPRDSLDDLVLDVVARHLQLRPDEVQLGQSVLDDLHLDPLDLVLIALRLEDIERVEFPIDALERVESLRDLADVMRELRRARSSNSRSSAAAVGSFTVSRVVRREGRRPGSRGSTFPLRG